MSELWQHFLSELHLQHELNHGQVCFCLAQAMWLTSDLKVM